MTGIRLEWHAWSESKRPIFRPWDSTWLLSLSCMQDRFLLLGHYWTASKQTKLPITPSFGFVCDILHCTVVSDPKIRAGHTVKEKCQWGFIILRVVLPERSYDHIGEKIKAMSHPSFWLVSSFLISFFQPFSD